MVEIPTPRPGDPTTAAIVVVEGGAETEGGISSLSETMLENQSETPHYSLLLKITTNKPNTFSQVIDYPDTSAQTPPGWFVTTNRFST